MTGSILAIVLIPIVVAAVLVFWLVMVFHAKNHPKVSDRGEVPDLDVTGGIFRGEGRQLMPRRDAPAGTVSGAYAPRDEEHEG